MRMCYDRYTPGLWFGGCRTRPKHGGTNNWRTGQWWFFSCTRAALACSLQCCDLFCWPSCRNIGYDRGFQSVDIDVHIGNVHNALRRVRHSIFQRVMVDYLAWIKVTQQRTWFKKAVSSDVALFLVWSHNSDRCRLSGTVLSDVSEGNPVNCFGLVDSGPNLNREDQDCAIMCAIEWSLP